MGARTSRKKTTSKAVAPAIGTFMSITNILIRRHLFLSNNPDTQKNHLQWPLCACAPATRDDIDVPRPYALWPSSTSLRQKDRLGTYIAMRPLNEPRSFSGTRSDIMICVSDAIPPAPIPCTTDTSGQQILSIDNEYLNVMHTSASYKEVHIARCSA